MNRFIFLSIFILILGQDFNQTSALEPELILMKYHHTEYVYKHDDIGVERLSLADIEKCIGERLCGL
jgi:hypothetical protein